MSGMMQMTHLLVFALITVPVASFNIPLHNDEQHISLSAQHVTLQSTFRPADCFRKMPVTIRPHLLGLISKHTGNGVPLPGAGLDEVVPFETVLKDGYSHIGCFKDYMLEHGDKFGDNKHEYEIGQASNVSIVRYADVVPKEDQKGLPQGRSASTFVAPCLVWVFLVLLMAVNAIVSHLPSRWPATTTFAMRCAKGTRQWVAVVSRRAMCSRCTTVKLPLPI